MLQGLNLVCLRTWSMKIREEYISMKDINCERSLKKKELSYLLLIT